MSMNFEDYQKEANNFLDNAMNHLKTLDKNKAGRILRAVLHAIRDRLPAGEAAHLGAQLPIIWKGIYFDGFKVGEPETIRNNNEWLQFIKDKNEFTKMEDFPTLDETQKHFNHVMEFLEAEFSAGQYDKIMKSLPDEIKQTIAH